MTKPFSCKATDTLLAGAIALVTRGNRMTKLLVRGKAHEPGNDLLVSHSVSVVDDLKNAPSVICIPKS